MCVLYVTFGSKVRPRTFGWVAMGSAVLFILRSRLLLYSAGAKTYRRHGCMYFLAELVLVLDKCMCTIPIQNININLHSKPPFKANSLVG